jgi:hypothetical protein
MEVCFRCRVFWMFHCSVKMKTSQFFGGPVFSFRIDSGTFSSTEHFMSETGCNWDSAAHFCHSPITVAARSKTWTVSARSNAGIVGWISLEAWTSVCVHSVFVLSCVSVAALRRADPPSKESYRLCTVSRNWKSGHGPTKGCRDIIIIIIFVIPIIDLSTGELTVPSAPHWNNLLRALQTGK